MSKRQRPYLFYDAVISICSKCFRKVEGKILFEDDRVVMTKRCPEHGWQKVLLADDVDYYRKCREIFIKPPEQPERYNTPIKYGCPYDCGLCPDHDIGWLRSCASSCPMVRATMSFAPPAG